MGHSRKAKTSKIDMMSVMGGKRFNLLVRLDSVDVPRLPSEPVQHLHTNSNTNTQTNTNTMLSHKFIWEGLRTGLHLGLKLRHCKMTLRILFLCKHSSRSAPFSCKPATLLSQIWWRLFGIMHKWDHNDSTRSSSQPWNYLLNAGGGKSWQSAHSSCQLIWIPRETLFKVVQGKDHQQQYHHQQYQQPQHQQQQHNVPLLL